MKTLDIKTYNNYILVGVLFIGFFLDFTNKILYSYSWLSLFEVNGSLLFRFGCILYFFYLNRKEKLLYYIIGLSILFVISYGINNGLELNKSLFFFIKESLKFIVPLFFYFNIRRTEIKKSPYLMWDFLVFVSFILVLTGLIFEVELFRSYGGIRFGYNGVFFTNNEYIAFLFLSLHYALLRFFNNPNKYNIYRIGVVVFLLMVSGAKASIFVIFSGALSLLFYHHKLIKVKYIIGTCSFMILSCLCFYFLNYEFFKSLFEEYSILTIITSRRNFLVLDALEYLKSNPMIFVIGGGDLFKYLTESDLVDLVIVYGIPGAIFYLVIFFRFLCTKWIPLIIFLISYVILGALSGHVMNNGITWCYFGLIIILYEKIYNEKQRREYVENGI